MFPRIKPIGCVLSTPSVHRLLLQSRQHHVPPSIVGKGHPRARHQISEVSGSVSLPDCIYTEMGCSVDADLCDVQDDNGTLTAPDQGTKLVNRNAHRHACHYAKS